MWADCGVNLLDKRFNRLQLYERAIENKVNKLLAISSTLEESKLLVEEYKQVITSFSASSFELAYTVGIHPHYADSTNHQTWSQMKTLIKAGPCAAIGECGLDFNRNFSSKRNQLYAFEQQLELASECQLGVYLHERDAFDEQVRLLEQYKDSIPFKVQHCFTGNSEQLEHYLALGCYIGITGWICDPKRGQTLRDAAVRLPLNRLLLETDSPYLFPKTLKPRKSINEPCNIPFIGEYLAQLLSVDINSITQHTYANALKLFFKQDPDEVNKGHNCR